MPVILLICLSLALCLLRFLVPTDPMLTWDEAFKAAAHIFVGMMLCLLIQKRGRWLLGWICLAVPTWLELLLFLAARG